MARNASKTSLRRLGLLAVVLLSLPLGSVRVNAQPANEATRRVFDALAKRGDLTLRDATLESALFTISELWGINIVAAQVDGVVNGVFKDAPLKDILDSILQSNGYAYRPVGGSLVINRLQELGQVNPFFVSETVPVGSAEVAEVVEAARLLSTPQGQVRAVPSARAVLVVDFPDRVQRVRELVAQLDAATRSLAAGGPVGVGPQRQEVAYFRTHYIPALQAGTALDVVLSPEGRVASVQDEDRLLVVDYPENIAMVRAVLARIDRPRPQVNIRSLIYDISLSDIERIGFNWNGITNGTIDAATGVATGQNSGVRFLSNNTASLGPNEQGASFSFFTLEGGTNIESVLVALQQATDSRLLSDPNVTVMDNELANIQSISEIPFQQLTQTGGGGNIGTTAFKEVGIKLDVTPKIARDGTIDLTVIPEFSRLAGFTETDNQPIIETRRATTRVRVANGQTMMIAGLRQRVDVGDFNGVPLLKDVRFLGHLFRGRNTQITESELVVFLTPEIVGYSDPLSQRNQLASDAVRCRLDYVPAAEGCPDCGGHGACGCGPIGSAVSPPHAVESTTGAQSIIAPSAADPQPTRPPLPDRIDPASVVPEIAPLPQPMDKVLPDPAATSQIRRLPSTAEASLAKAEGRLRVDYESRFRATGGVYPGQQRLAERPTDPAPPEEESAKPWYGGLLFWK